MCLAVPGQIVSFAAPDAADRMGRVDFGGVIKEVSLAFTPEAVVGDYVIVHAGCAISQLDEEEAQAALAEFAALDALKQH